MERFGKYTAWALAGSMALGAVSGDDDSIFRDLRQDGFAVAIPSTGPTATNSGGEGGIEFQNHITGEINAGPNYVIGVPFVDPSSGSTATT